MPKRLTRLKVREVSAVDRGAGEGVRVVLLKNADGSPAKTKAEKREAKIVAYLARDLFAEAEALAKTEKREFSADERQRLAGTGAAEADGSFPIASEQDLKNAIRAVGRSKNPAKTRAHIMSRARSLGLTRLIPSRWTGAKKALDEKLAKFLVSIGIDVDKALDFNAVQANAEAREYVDGMMQEIGEAMSSLRQAVCEIMCDESVADKQAAVETTFQQFRNHLTGLVPEGIEQALLAAQLFADGARVNPQGALVGKRKGKAMAEQPADLETKLKGQKDRRRTAETALAAEQLANKALQEQLKNATASLASADTRLLSVLKMSPAHRDWLNHPDNEMSVDERLAFVDAPLAKRDEIVAASPPEKLLEKRLAGMPASIRTEIEENRLFRKQQTEEADAAVLVTLTKRATELGFAAEMGPQFVTLHKAAPEAMATVLKRFDELAEAFKTQDRTSDLFKVFGAQGGEADANSAAGRMEARVAEIMKADSDVKTPEQAINKVAESRIPGDQKLWREYRDETDQRRAA